jgi:hypothetical protein
MAIKAGDRVTHVSANLSGTVKSVKGEYARIRWDHFGLAIVALGSIADLQRIELLTKIDNE